MKNTIRDIKKVIPNLQSEKVEVLADELDRIQALKTLFRSDGGQQLIGVLKRNCAAALRKLYSAMDDKPTLEILMGLIARYTANLDLLAELQDVTIEDEIQTQLDEAVKEAAAHLM